MAVQESGIYVEPTAYTREHERMDYGSGSGMGAIAEMIKRLTADLGTMISLKLDLLKAEVTESVRGYAKDGAMLGVAAVLAVFATIFLNVTLMFFVAWLLPFSTAVNFMLGALAVTLLHLIGAGILVIMVRSDMKKRTIVPERSVEEMKRDKQWLSETIA